MNPRGLMAAAVDFALSFIARVEAQTERPAKYKGWDASTSSIWSGWSLTHTTREAGHC